MKKERFGFLLEKNSELYNRLLYDYHDDGKINIVDARNGQKTIQLFDEGRKQYIHSVYHPDNEVELLIKKYRTSTSEGVPIIFIGAGLGYHIEPIVESFQPIWFSIVEFHPSILRETINFKNWKKSMVFPKLKNFHLLTNKEEYLGAVIKDLQDTNKTPQIIILPSYERVFKKEIDEYLKALHQYLKEKKSHFATTIGFQKRWTYNSLRNFPYLFKTPNLLTDFDRSVFENKPVVLVAAGPSLNEEFDNLRRIKRNRSAYIFSVGSAINALIEHDIFPDAAFTYDPTQHNQFVFQKIKEKRIKDVPMIFGSSVGFETLENYPGKMAHFITSQDFISAYTIKHNEYEEIDIAVDSPSIAVITLQLINILNMNPIILVGQNFSYKKNKRYALGIEYELVKSELNEKEIEDAYEIESVDGGKVLSNEGYVRMKQSMEHFLALMENKTVYNTTKNGAKIEHTIYKELDELLRLLPNGAKPDNWFTHEKPNYNIDFMKEKWNRLIEESENFPVRIDEIDKILKKIEETVNVRRLNKLPRMFIKLDEKVNVLLKTLFYKVFISSMTRFEYEIVSKEISMVRNSTNIIDKAKVIVKQYSRLIKEWKTSYQLVIRDLKEVNDLISGL